MTTKVNIKFGGHKSYDALDVLDKIVIFKQNMSRNPC